MEFFKILLFFQEIKSQNLKQNAFLKFKKILLINYFFNQNSLINTAFNNNFKNKLIYYSGFEKINKKYPINSKKLYQTINNFINI
ncbi:hypothetical protein CV643_02235 [Borreliella burgdorferi]|nr:hypothetical protein CV697_02055 [Borreliella burgdorferi]PRQ91431.1 hypothetical protein CV691_02055 [Borreliella burgdorferi]PRQ92664.1 hypothetical protein CV690_02055 [Borreliella burgdorferi]PRQ95637.1 hypothetical protein CV684_02235 [Borreliella burgdorferi]PRQ98399.1 hypothetical protein CV674_02235 [Borreliella burgdorferi]